MNNEKNMHSSLYEVVPIDFPQGVGYISDIEMITMSITGILEAQVSNMTLNESCMMLINAIKVRCLKWDSSIVHSILYDKQ